MATPRTEAKRTGRKGRASHAGRGESRKLRGNYKKLLGLRTENNLAVVEHVKRGLQFNSVERLREQMDLSSKDMAELLQIKFRTFLRRKKEGRLRPDESDRLIRASRLFARAVDLFDGNAEAAKAWLLRAQRALGGAVPLEMARTELGAREVERVIGRLEHGVFT
ncbi:MAG TPA: antitoxin Xre/MbcA/ParS toxin-binding domain-containing protein [Blastocatellia bacterium]|jgi:putative toxin-antitoxin system antitoxin component (TIGR02293 family)